MSFLIIGSERFALEYGDTILGGRGDKALGAEALGRLQPFAIVTCALDAPATIRAIGALPVTVSGDPLRREPDVLQHGDRIDVSGLSLAYGEMSAAGRTSAATEATDQSPLGAFLQNEAEATASTGGRLTRLRARAVREVPDRGLTIGRDPSCDMVLASRAASRVHATIAPSVLGYTLIDQSANGIVVNGVRMEGHRVLRQGDTLRIADEDFRFEADPASFAPDVPVQQAAPESVHGPSPQSLPEAPAPLLASIEVLSGPLKGLRFRLTRPTAEIGRAPGCDVQLADESISGRHASLVQRGNSWTILDLNSRNGTLVEGEIVRDQRVLPGVCEMQLGTLRLLFRSINRSEPGAGGTVRVIGVTGDR